MSKLVYSPTSNLIEGTYENITSTSLVENSVYYSLAFTGDGYFYTHGKKFRLFEVTQNGPAGISFSITDGIAGVYIDNVSIGTGVVVLNITGDGIIIPTWNNGTVALSHSTPLTLETAQTTFGSISNIPILTVDQAGHITSIQNSTAIDVTKVAGIQAAVDTNYYIVGVTDANALNPGYNTNIYLDSLGSLHATTFYQGGSTLASLYTPISHVTVYADDTTYGHVIMSDAIDPELDVDDSTAATPKAVSLALQNAKNYADLLVAAQDAMVFIGTLLVDGTITSHNNDILSTVVDGTTNIDSIPYKIGYTFRFTESGTFYNEEVEVGDMLIAVADKNSTFAKVDWTVIQTNISGALTSASNLNGLLYADNSRIVLSLVLSNGVLYYGNNSLNFVNPNTLWRDIQVNGTSIGIHVANLKYTGAVSITPDTNNGDITFSVDASTILLSAYDLTVKAGNTEFKYNPSTASTLEIGNKLSLNLNNSTNNYEITHATAANTYNGILGTITTDAYGHISSITEVTSLKNPNKIKFDLSSGNILEYDGFTQKILVFGDGTDISFSSAVDQSNENKIIITPTISHKYRAIQYYPNLTSSSSTSVLASNVNTVFTIVGGTNVSISNIAANGQDTLPAGTIRIDAEDTWRDIQSYTFTSNVFSRNSISTNTLKFSEDFIWGNEELSIVWEEIDAQGIRTYVR